MKPGTCKNFALIFALILYKINITLKQYTLNTATIKTLQIFVNYNTNHDKNLETTKIIETQQFQLILDNLPIDFW